MLQKISISNICFFWAVYLSKNWIEYYEYCYIDIFNIEPNQHIRMISEGSRDTQAWINGCWTFCFAITEIHNI